MDTPKEIARDEWWQAHLYGCETCKYVKRGKTGKYYCDNKNAVGYEGVWYDVFTSVDVKTQERRDKCYLKQR